MILAVSLSPVKGGATTKKYGYKHYVGNKKYWYVYEVNDLTGKFNRHKINPLEVPFYKAKVQKMKTYTCFKCKTKFKVKKEREMLSCPFCGVGF